MSFYETLTAAIAAIAAAGFQSDAAIAEWAMRLRYVAQREMMSDSEIREHLRQSLGAIYRRQTAHGLMETNPGVGRFTLQMLAPQMQAELERRITASAGLIRLNQQAAVDKTLQRFSGWCTSVPAGGSEIVDKREVKGSIAKPTRDTRYEARRVAIDQGHKLSSSLSEIVARGTGAIAGKWRHILPRPGYSPRHSHVERNGNYYAVPDNWAITAGLMKKGAGYIDEITKPAEEPFCSCKYVWVTSLASLPDEMLTEKGRAWLAERKAA